MISFSRVAELKRFWLLALLSLVGYGLLFRWFPFRNYFNHSPSPDIRTLAPSLTEAAAYAILLSVLYGLYWITYRTIRGQKEGLSLLTILLTTATFCLPLIFTFPVNSTDLYRYFLRGRISVTHDLNPFEVPPADLQDEPYLPLAGEWAIETSPYGPLWELSATAMTRLAPDNLWLGILFFKGLASLAHLAATGLIWLSLSHLSNDKRASLTLLWAWNPSILLILAMNGHNDGFMIIWLLLGWWLMVKGRAQAGMITMMLAPLVKPIGLLPLPFFFISHWGQLPSLTGRLRFLILSLVAVLILVILAFLPYGSPVSLIMRLVREVSGGGGFSPSALLILELRRLGLNPSISTTTQIGTLLFLLFALFLAWVTWQGRSQLKAAADIFVGYILQAFRFRIWYAAWPYPWLILDRGNSAANDIVSQARLAVGLTFLFTSQLSALVYGQLRVELLGGSQLRAHRLGIVLTFLVPIFVGFAVAVYNARLRDRQREK
jgi:hypothetical protein